MELMKIILLIVIVLAVIHGLKGAFGSAKRPLQVHSKGANAARSVHHDDEEDMIDTYIREGDPETDPSRVGSAAYIAQQSMDQMFDEVK